VSNRTTPSSPLQEIELAVQQQAARESVTPDSPSGESRIRELISESIDNWRAEHQRGIREHSLAHPEAVAERAFRNIARAGPLTELLDDPDVWEIMVNSPTKVFIKRHSRPGGFHSEVFHDDEHVARTLTKLLDESSTSHRKLDPTEGLQDAQLSNGARMHIVHGDLSRGGHLMVNIRKFTGVSISELSQMVELGSISREAADYLSAAVKSRQSIVFAGSPGAGKTTLLNCCASELDPSLRVVVAEEVFETEIPVANVAQMQTRPPRADRDEIDLRKLVSGFLRMAPDVAIVGEVRDREALPLLLTLSSGVTGYTTIHAGSARQALTRLRFLAQLSQQGSEVPVAALNSLVSEAIDLVVHTERGTDGPRVSEIVAVEDLIAGPDSVQFTTTDVFTRRGVDEELTWSGDLPIRSSAKLERRGFDPRQLLQPSIATTGAGNA
jgi:pilus assembly protein CpaF